MARLPKTLCWSGECVTWCLSSKQNERVQHLERYSKPKVVIHIEVESCNKKLCHQWKLELYYEWCVVQWNTKWNKQKGLLNWPHSLLKRSQSQVTRSYDLSIFLSFHCTREEEQGINFVLKIKHLINLDDKSKPSWHLTYWLWLF